MYGDQFGEFVHGYGNFLCLSPPSASLALQYGGFVPREWLAAKGLFQGDPSGFKKGLE